MTIPGTYTEKINTVFLLLFLRFCFFVPSVAFRVKKRNIVLGISPDFLPPAKVSKQ